MGLGGSILNWLFGFSKLIALAIAIFLVSASLDNVPDCPELLNSSSGSSVSLQLIHHDAAARPGAIQVSWEAFPAPAVTAQYSADELLAMAPACVTRSLYQAADPSPPSA